MTQEKSLAAACGLFCGDCEFIWDKCAGCNDVKGKPFWAEMYNLDVCPVYGCCVDEKQLEHCGLCERLPCNTFTSLRDPALSDEEYEKSLIERQKNLNSRKERGTGAWLKERE